MGGGGDDDELEAEGGGGGRGGRWVVVDVGGEEGSESRLRFFCVRGSVCAA